MYISKSEHFIGRRFMEMGNRTLATILFVLVFA